MGKFKKSPIPSLVKNYLNNFLKKDTIVQLSEQLETKNRKLLNEVEAPLPTEFQAPEPFLTPGMPYTDYGFTPHPHRFARDYGYPKNFSWPPPNGTTWTWTSPGGTQFYFRWEVGPDGQGAIQYYDPVSGTWKFGVPGRD
jgi:hypothetical protein